MSGPAPHIARVVGLALMVGAVLVMSFSVLFGVGLVMAWIGETGLTDELRPWVIATLATAAFFIAVGYGVFVLGRRLREHDEGP